MKKIICAITLILLTASAAFAGINAKRQVKKGNALFEEGKYKESMEHYKKASSSEPNSSIINYNLGVASYKLKEFEKAVGFFNRAWINDEEEDIKKLALYNLANSEYMHGISMENSNLQEAINQLTQSLRHYEKALEIDNEDEDAKYNHEFVKKELDRLKKKMQQQAQEHKEQEQKQKQQQQEQAQDSKAQEDKEQEQKQKQQQQQKAQEDKEQEQKENQQQQEQAQDSKSQEQKDKDKQKQQQQQSGSSSVSQDQKKNREELSESQAAMLLDRYRHEEEPKGLYKERIDTSGMPRVDKDW